MANFLRQLVRRTQGAISIAKPLIVPRFAPSMAIAGNFWDFSVFEPSSLEQKTKIDLDRKPDTLSPKKELRVTPDIGELMSSLPLGHWSINRSRLHQIETLEPFNPFEFNNFAEGRSQEAENSRELGEDSSVSPDAVAEEPPTRSPVVDNLVPTSSQPAATLSPETELSSTTVAENRRELGEDSSVSPDAVAEEPPRRSPVVDNLAPTSSQPAPTLSPETELSSTTVAENRRELREDSSFSPDSVAEEPSTRSPVVDNLAPTSSQPAAAVAPAADHKLHSKMLSEETEAKARVQRKAKIHKSTGEEKITSINATQYELASQADDSLSKQATNSKPTIVSPQLQPQVKSKSAEDGSLSPTRPSLNNSKRTSTSLVQPLQPEISTPATQENSASNQFNYKLNNSRSQLSPEPIENSSSISPSTLDRQQAIDNRQQSIPRTVQPSPLPIPDNAQKSNTYSQQQLSTAVSSSKTAEIKPLVDLADRSNAQYSRSSIEPNLTDVPPKKIIEIKIGRIIARAAEQPSTKTQSSPRRPKSKKPALSLKDYLKQRGKP